MSAIVKIQEILGVEPDGIWGPKSKSALEILVNSYAEPDDGWHQTTATSFADAEDLRKFNECKSRNNNSDQYCFNYGDNCIGIWKDPTGEGTGPCCALPIGAWHDFYSAARKKKVQVEVGDKTAIVELKDSSGTRDVIDLNPDACEMLGLSIPVKEPARWRWV